MKKSYSLGNSSKRFGGPNQMLTRFKICIIVCQLAQSLLEVFLAELKNEKDEKFGWTGVVIGTLTQAKIGPLLFYPGGVGFW